MTSIMVHVVGALCFAGVSLFLHYLQNVCILRVVTEFDQLVARVETNVESIGPSRLRRDMVNDHPVYGLFMSGSSTGIVTLFYCMICLEGDVSIQPKKVFGR